MRTEIDLIAQVRDGVTAPWWRISVMGTTSGTRPWRYPAMTSVLEHVDVPRAGGGRDAEADLFIGHRVE
jgi:hypothetical protein